MTDRIPLRTSPVPYVLDPSEVLAFDRSAGRSRFLTRAKGRVSTQAQFFNRAIVRLAFDTRHPFAEEFIRAYRSGVRYVYREPVPGVSVYELQG